MIRSFSSTAARAGLALAAMLLVASTASAQYREFSGRVDKINAQKLIVDNRRGDKVMFERLDETRVSGQSKSDWQDLRRDDWVTVHWKMSDRPRKAYRVRVQPPKP